MYLRSYHIAVYNECEIQEQHLYITLRERKTEFTLLHIHETPFCVQ
jgi:hypothetical protein